MLHRENERRGGPRQSLLTPDEPWLCTATSQRCWQLWLPVLSSLTWAALSLRQNIEPPKSRHRENPALLLCPEQLLCRSHTSASTVCDHTYPLYHLRHLGAINAKAEERTIPISRCQRVWSTALEMPWRGERGTSTSLRKGLRQEADFCSWGQEFTEAFPRGKEMISSIHDL